MDYRPNHGDLRGLEDRLRTDLQDLCSELTAKINDLDAKIQEVRDQMPEVW